MSEETDLQALIAQLTARVAELEQQVSGLEANHVIDDETIAVIAGAVAAYLGHKATVKAIRFRREGSWQSETRGRVHDRQVRLAR